MRYFLILLNFLIFGVGHSQNAYLIASQQPLGGGSTLLSPPLASNPNPELITGNAAAYGIDEANNVTTGVETTQVTLTAVTDDDGYEGDLAMNISADAVDGSYSRHLITGQTGGTTYEWAFDARVIQNAGVGMTVRYVDASGATDMLTDFTNAAWGTPLTGTFTTSSNTTNFRIEVYITVFFGGSDVGDNANYKLSLKVQ